MQPLNQTSNLHETIQFIETNFDVKPVLMGKLRSLNDPLERAVFAGLLRIKLTIRDQRLDAYLEAAREQAYKHLFP